VSQNEITVREILLEGAEDQAGMPEVERLVALERACGLSSFGPESYRRKAGRPENLLFGAFDTQGGLLGLFTGEIVLDEFQIDNLAVHPDRRRSGIGMLLIRMGLDEARRRGGARALLEVRASNWAARQLYEKNGFLLIGTRRDYYREPLEDALVLALDLEPVFVRDAENLS
jgi:ribosomal-protein-alanine N-acetyltransferase